MEGSVRAALIVLMTIALGELLLPAAPPQEQPTPVAIAGAWSGWMNVAGNYQPIRASFSPQQTPPGAVTNLMTGLSLPLRAVSVDGASVRVEWVDPRPPVLTGTIEPGSITGTAAASGGRSGTFRLLRTAALDEAALGRFVGAYRFADGRYLLVDMGYPPGSGMLYAIDPQTGQTRAMYPASSTEFNSGPALLVPEPTEQTLSFTMRGDRIVGVVRRYAGGAAERAARVELHLEEVRFRSGDVVLAGTLVLPSGRGPHPGLVFAHGGGATTREQYWGFGYLMAARGFAVLAFDKRGTGESTGQWRNATFENLADDVVAGARFLQSRSELDRRRIGYWGLSQGAWIAPLAAVRSGDAAFVITMSGGGLTPAQGELFDSEYEMRTAGLSERDVQDGLTFQRTKNEYLRTRFGWETYEALLKQATGRPWWRLPGTDLSGPATPDDAYWANNTSTYFYDPGPTLHRLRAPMLAILGELDSPEGVKANVVGIRTALENTKHPDFTIRVFPNGRHNLMDIGGFPPNEYPRLTRFVPGLFETMASWMERHAKN
jgi:pimeloyl-ACP methyl ester carboxylesterase